MFIEDKKDCNYFWHWLDTQQKIGEISNLIMVNLHAYNSISPDQIVTKIRDLKESLDLFQKKYTEECNQILFDMEH